MVGEMYFVHQRFVRCAKIEDGWAWLQHIDLDGVVHVTSAPVSSLMPAREFFRPRTAWPVAGDLDVLEAEREERARQSERKAQAKAARKARRSMKIKRGVAA